MHVINSKNINHAYSDGLWWLKSVFSMDRMVNNSRYGDVIVSPVPVTTVYQNPRERVLFSPTRDANPFFHFFESLWMLRGRTDSKFLMEFNKRMGEFAKDDGHYHGAYGNRWLQHFGFNQLEAIVHELQDQPNSRRAVLQIWDCKADLNVDSNDIPCNTHVYFGILDDELNMTVCCRSNDAIWGAYGANAVHFSYLQEYLACELGASVGWYTQMSNNFHIYTTMPRFEEIWGNPQCYDLYEDDVAPGPMLMEQGGAHKFQTDLIGWFENPTSGNDNEFLSTVATPMWNLWKNRKQPQWEQLCLMIVATDWQRACSDWIKRKR